MTRIASSRSKSSMIWVTASHISSDTAFVPRWIVEDQAADAPRLSRRSFCW